MTGEEVVQLREQIIVCIREKKIRELRQIFEEFPIVDIADAIDQIKEISDLLFIFRVVNSDYTAELFTDLTDDQQKLLVNAFGDKQLVELLENSFADDIVDSLQDMPANLVSRVLSVAPHEIRSDINRLLNYKENTAGSIMTTEFLLFEDKANIKETIDSIRTKGREAETVYTVFVRDEKRNLVGTVDLDDLIFAKEDQILKDIMNIDFQTVSVNTDQEEIAQMFKRYDLNAMAVVNASNHICGVITVDDVVDVIAEEAAEDITAISGVRKIKTSYLDTPVWKLVIKCAPMILVLMVLQVFSALILSGFQDQIAKFAILSVFTPLIMDSSGNSGGQTTGLMVRSLALDEFKRGDEKKVIWKEFRVGVLVGLITAIVGFGWFLFEMSVGIVQCHLSDYPQITAITNDTLLHLCIAGLVSITLFVSIAFSKIVGVLLCLLVDKMHRDPAVIVEPLLTTLADIAALLTYFAIWTLVFTPMLGL